jgi:plastocyanin
LSRLLTLAAAVAVAFAGAAPAFADTKVMVIIKDHVFQPSEIRVPAGEKIILTVDNQDATPEEFESHELRVEKVVPGGSRGVVRFGPLEAGAYPFFGEFNEATAQGKVIAE